MSEDIETRALERLMVRRGEMPPPAVTIEPAEGTREPLLPPPGSAALPPDAFGATGQRLIRALGAPFQEAAGAARAVGALAGAAFNPVNMLDDLQGALQNVSPVLMNRAIEAGAVEPLGSVNDVVQQDDGSQFLGGTRLDPDQHVVWRGAVYPRRFIDPASGSTLDATVAETTDVTDVAEPGLVQAATRLGRLFMAVLPDPLGGPGLVAATAREAVRPTIGMAARAGVGGAGRAAAVGRYIRRGEIEYFARPDGSPDIGAITSEIGAQIGREAAPIRLPRERVLPDGRVLGEQHILDVHPELAERGIDVGEFVADVAANFDRIHRGGGGALFLVKDARPNRLAIIELQPAPDGAAWEVVTAFEGRPDFAARRELLWERGAQSRRSTPEGSGSRSGQSKPNVAPRAPENNDGR